MKKKNYIIILILLPLIIKLIIAFMVEGHIGDMIIFKWISDTLVNGQSIYSIKELAPLAVFSPIFYFLSIINGLVVRVTGIPFYFIHKITPLIAESIIALVIFLILNRKYSIKKSFFWSMLFALNPMNLIVYAVHGQIDPLPILGIILSFYFFTKDKTKYILPALCLALGAGFKYYPLFLIPVLFFKFDKKIRIKFLLTAIAAYLLIHTPFILSGDFLTSITQPFKYSAGFNWGIAKFFLLVDVPFIEYLLMGVGKFFLAFMLVVTVLIYRKSEHINKSYKMVFYCIYVFSFFMHPHYLTWIIPFLFLEPYSKELLYMIPLTIHVYFLYGFKMLNIGINLPPVSFIFGILTWVFCLYIYVKNIKQIGFKNV